MSLLDTFWDRNDVQTVVKMFKDCGIETTINFQQYRQVCVSVEDVFRMLLNSINEQTFFIEYVVNENNLKLYFNYLVVKIVKKLKEQNQTYKEFVHSLTAIDNEGFTHIDSLVEKLHAMDIIITSFELIVLKAYLQYNDRSKQICLYELYKALEEMINYISLKHPTYLKTDKIDLDDHHENAVIASHNQDEDENDDLLIKMLNTKKTSNPQTNSVSKVDSWENDLLYAIQVSTHEQDLVTILNFLNKYIHNHDNNQFSESNLNYLFKMASLNVSDSEIHSLFHHLKGKYSTLTNEFITKIIRDKNQAMSDNFKLSDLVETFDPVSLMELVCVQLNYIQPQVRNFDKVNENLSTLGKSLYLQFDSELTLGDPVFSDLFAFTDKYEKSFMETLLKSNDHTVNHLKFDLNISSEHVIKKNKLTKTIDEDASLEVFICEQDEFRDKPLFRAEVLYSDFMSATPQATNLRSVNRNLIFYDVKDNQPFFKVNCDLKYVTLPNFKEKQITTTKSVKIKKMYPQINKFNMYLYNLHNINLVYIDKPIQIEVFKHFKQETILIDTIDTIITHQPTVPSGDAKLDYTYSHIFNSHTLLNKNYSFNAIQSELDLAQLEFKFYTESYYVGNFTVELTSAIKNFKGIYGTFSLNTQGQPSPFLMDLLITPVDVMDHFLYNKQFKYLDFIRMHYSLDYTKLMNNYEDYSLNLKSNEILKQKEKKFSEINNSANKENRELNDKISKLENEVKLLKRKESEILLKHQEKEIELAKKIKLEQEEKDQMDTQNLNDQNNEKTDSTNNFRDTIDYFNTTKKNVHKNMKFSVNIYSVYDLNSSDKPESALNYSIMSETYTTELHKGQMPYFNYSCSHYVDTNCFYNIDNFQLNVVDSNCSKKLFVLVDLTLLKSMGKNEGWYFIQDSIGVHYGQVYIGLVMVNENNKLEGKIDNSIEFADASVNEEYILNKHKTNLLELDNINHRLKNYLETDKFEDSVSKNIHGDMKVESRKKNDHSIQSSFERSISSSLKRTNKDDDMQVTDLEKTLKNNETDEIDKFIQNAKEIQNRINEAINYDHLDNNSKENIFKNTMNKYNLETIDDVSYENESHNSKQKVERELSPNVYRNSFKKEPLSPKFNIPFEELDLNYLKYKKEKIQDYKNDELKEEPSDSDENTYQSRKKPKLKYSSILKSPAFKKELENLNRNSNADFNKIGNILKKY